MRIWRAFDNEYWPAHYFIDAEGRVRHHHFGEGSHDESERVIQQLLAEAGKTNVSSDVVDVKATGAEAASDQADVKSPETYVGYMRSENFLAGDKAANDAPFIYTASTPRLNEWGLTGNWTVGAQQASLNESNGSVYYRFHARDLHLVLGPGADGKPVRFQVTVDGKAPGDNPRRRYRRRRQWHGDRPAALLNLSAEVGLSPTIRSKSSSLIPASRHTPSPSAENRASDALVYPRSYGGDNFLGVKLDAAHQFLMAEGACAVFQLETADAERLDDRRQLGCNRFGRADIE